MKGEITLAEARRAIREQIEERGQFSHNMVSIVLRQVSKRYGYTAANGLVRDLELEAEFGICEAKEPPA